MQADREIPTDRQNARNLDFRGGTTFTMGGAILSFEGDGDAAAVLRYDVGTRYTVMQRR